MHMLSRGIQFQCLTLSIPRGIFLTLSWELLTTSGIHRFRNQEIKNQIIKNQILWRFDLSLKGQKASDDHEGLGALIN